MDTKSNLSCIKGVGPKTLEILNSSGIFNIMDLLLYFPRNYENIGNPKEIKDAVLNEKILIKCRVVKCERDVRTRLGKTITTVVFNDGINTFKGKWFNQIYMKNKFYPDMEVTLLGKLYEYRGELVLQNPQIQNEVSGTSKKIIPIYPLKNNLTNSNISKIIDKVLNNITIEENLPKYLIEKHNLCSLDEAIREIHRPTSKDKLLAARNRLKYQELFAYSFKLLLLKENIRSSNIGIPFIMSSDLSKLKEILPYKLTGAQTRVIREILMDEKKSSSMNRLVQGDVGSGKTIVSIISLFNVIKNGYQGALMAPTEILAMQHYLEITNLLKKFDIKIELLSGSLKNSEKKAIKQRLSDGDIDLIVGTHALLEDDVQFKNLGMVVTDEQHRFGVMQRSRLFNKGINIDILVMTATPIPRTLSLCLYGDLDVSIIDELPPGRQKIDTYFVKDAEKEKAYKLALKAIKEGRQVYVVCPLVEESEEIDCSSVQMTYNMLKESYFSEYSMEILHGKMSPKEKNEVMDRFKNDETKILVSTTVVEVGVNVPNASVMIIENAERFGLSQLHQLRGRVGRGMHKSYCILIANSKSENCKKRMEIMCKSNDGFYIAEEDLKLRGAGEIFGVKQSGANQFILSDIIYDSKLLIIASQDAKDLNASECEANIKMRKYLEENINNNSRLICFN